MQSGRRLFSSIVRLGDLKPAPGSHKKAKRRGRGIAAHGHSCGRGANGQKSRSGGTPGPGFTGGQTPFHLTMPKVGFHNPNGKEYYEINLDRLQHLIDTGRLDSSKPITIKSFIDAGITDLRDGIKVLGAGNAHFKTPIEIHATRFTKQAIKTIEELGGKALAVYHSETGIRQLKNPERFWRKNPVKSMEKLDLPSKLRDRLFYTQEKNRGYLSSNANLSDEFKQIYQTI